MPVSLPSPSPFVTEWVPRVATWLPSRSRALDLAMGSGRHVPVLSSSGFKTFGVDISFDAVEAAVAAARQSGSHLRGFCADMTTHPLPHDWFHLVLVTRYLDRERLPALKAAVAPRGVVLYETFTTDQLRLGRGPISRHHLLEPGELTACFHDFDVLFSEQTTAPDALARIVARRRVRELP